MAHRRERLSHRYLNGAGAHSIHILSGLILRSESRADSAQLWGRGWRGETYRSINIHKSLRKSCNIERRKAVDRVRDYASFIKFLHRSTNPPLINGPLWMFKPRVFGAWARLRAVLVFAGRINCPIANYYREAANRIFGNAEDKIAIMIRCIVTAS